MKRKNKLEPIYTESRVKGYMKTQNEMILDFIYKHSILLTVEQDLELNEILETGVSDVEYMPEAEYGAEQVSDAFKNLNYKEKDYVIKENLDYITDQVRYEIESEYDVMIKLKGDMWRLDKLNKFIEAEIFPHYNERAEYLKMF